jgi:hypothetical protein
MARHTHYSLSADVPVAGGNVITLPHRGRTDLALAESIRRFLAAGASTNSICARLGVPPMMIARVQIEQYIGQALPRDI